MSCFSAATSAQLSDTGGNHCDGVVMTTTWQRSIRTWPRCVARRLLASTALVGGMALAPPWCDVDEATGNADVDGARNEPRLSGTLLGEGITNERSENGEQRGALPARTFVVASCVDFGDGAGDVGGDRLRGVERRPTEHRRRLLLLLEGLLEGLPDAAADKVTERRQRRHQLRRRHRRRHRRGPLGRQDREEIGDDEAAAVDSVRQQSSMQLTRSCEARQEATK